jgi:hypothetical protein
VLLVMLFELLIIFGILPIIFIELIEILVELLAI